MSVAADTRASPRQCPRREKSISPWAMLNLCLRTTLPQEQTVFFLFQPGVWKARQLSKPFSTLSLSFFFFPKPEFTVICLRILGSGEPSEPRPGGRSDPLPLSASSGSVFLPDSHEIIPQPAVVGLKCGARNCWGNSESLSNYCRITSAKWLNNYHFIPV